ncbi:glutamate-tRNA ligase [Dictyostelium discoideum AX4]|uniref:Probable glutamate--tRNA ligase, cytoplasmic n=1 Tax=Dictyostelium discoideum TaxID=44689 RepID=SYEC_DICDI|nr:glutamate-tRNA ligase [Dictyostelium discoideum AX4]Q54KB8.1 RecName: Full=Probable glutamate--tRNA ligase, cytoplasmic; AltName: Full=Glutamyl-tRNA synthetase; Short=GluRS [Dictyostelium discoideum]EAL63699.1 glutamate-tRNA ligase [Dictyostelium discoideum AX4]|eukprot:XP_637203.1 glutamate-tRNA ligase [Dictyostelium discoideum AX4]
MSKAKDTGILRFDDTPLAATFPLVAIITSKVVGGVKIVGRKGLDSTEFSIVGTQDSLKGSYVIAKYLARTTPSLSLYGENALSASKIDEFIDKFAHLKSEKFNEFLKEMNEYLTLRAFLIGFNLTLADIVLFARIKMVKEIQEEINKLGKTIPHLNRWYGYLSQLESFVEADNAFNGKKETKASGKAGAEGTAATTEKVAPQKGAMGWVGNFEALNLPGLVEGKVVTRFPPEPSGYMHIGHCKAAIINNYYAEKYNGKIIIRFDDTNPSKEKEEYVENIIKDINNLGIKYEKITHTSDYFDLIHDYAIQMIKEGIAYCDDTPQVKMSEERDNAIESVHRNNSVEKNLEMFDEMKKATEQGVKCVLRAKLDMAHIDKAFRDPAIYRCNSTPHHRTGDKYKVYPLYDFACPIVDSVEGITHALRSNEYNNKRNLYNHYLEILHLENKPYISDYSRLSFFNVLLSKRKLQHFVDTGLVSGWTDPRLPTLQGITRRGLTVAALKEFILSQGASAANTTLDLGKLFVGNKAVLEPTCPRYTAIAKATAVKFTLSNGPTLPEVKDCLKYAKDPSMGTKKVTFSNNLLLEGDDCNQIKEGEEVTLMNWGNAIVETLQRNENGDVVSMTGKLHLEGDVKKTDKKLSWLSSDCADTVTVVLQDYDYIITKPKLEDGDDLDTFTNKNSKFEIEAFTDENILTLKLNDKIQFERRGFFNVDQVGDGVKPYILIYIPSGPIKPAGAALYPFKKVEKVAAPVNPKPTAKKQEKQSKK